MAFLLIRTDDASIDRDMIGYERLGHDAFVKPEVFGRMAGVDSRETSFKLLAVATGVARVWYVRSEISPILPKPMFVPQVMRQAGQGALIGGVFHITPLDMLKCLQEGRLLMDEGAST